MPLHRIYHPEGCFSEEEKRGLAESITEFYQGVGLPRFYVLVLFIPVSPKSFYVGGKSSDKFVRISVQHLARKMMGKEVVDHFMENYEQCLAPFIKAKGFHWEVAVEELDRDLWRENGLVPPNPRSRAEAHWRELDEAVPYAEEDNDTLPTGQPKPEQ